MPADHKEIAFETAIEQHLLTNGGYRKGDPHAVDRELAIFPKEYLEFLQATQPQALQSLKNIHGENTESVIIDALTKAMDLQGALAVIRHGFKCFGKQLQVAYFAPAHGLNPDTEKLYRQNILSVTRQVHYSTANENSLDMVLSLNGIPVVTAELKNQMSGQTVSHAKKQYMTDRDPREKLFDFKKRSLVHFAVDPDLVFMTTQLKKQSTYFLPFNKGDHGGAGNPLNPAGHKTSYLWEEVWQRDSLLDILGRFMHLEVIEKKIGGRTVKKEMMIFPRYHQLDAVRKLIARSREEGPGHNYLIQHSAGSGKSNSIAWLAHRLQSLHNAEDKKLFSSVIVVTDRIVLDEQLQNTIYQFEHKQGVVARVTESNKSTQLAAALNVGTPIIIVTIQTFPFVTEKLAELKDKTYAVIIDEAHSSASGETAAELKGVLADEHIKQSAREQAEAEGLTDYEEEILKTIKKRGQQPNLSFYAFTATPKYKTLECFGSLDAAGQPAPFHLYSMRQAIEERFILDVLQHYTTYKTYYGLIKSVEEDPMVKKKKAAKALARFMSLHPHNIAQKVEVMVEHFRTFTRHKIGGKAKAMVVTSSRLHAVRYKLAFDEYIKTNGYSDLRTLVAFSGTVNDPDLPGSEYTEPGMNPDPETGKPIGYKELPEKFGGAEFSVLIVADKYQTGFDQPLLHTMYVDKRLSGVQAVQTLSRLNRTHAGKEDTFVLDFFNETEEILESFRPYYEQPLIADRADPQQLYALQATLDEKHIYHLDEIEAFCQVFFAPKKKHSTADHARMNSILDPAVQRFTDLEEDDREEFRSQLGTFRNLYSLLAQILPFGDTDLEKHYSFIRFLLTKLPRRETGPLYNFDDEVDLQYYRLQKISEGSIELSSGGELKGPTDVGTGAFHEDEVELSALIDVLNSRLGTDFTEADQLFFDQIKESAVADGDICDAAKANTKDNFKYVFDEKIEGLFVDRMDHNSEIFDRFMQDKDFQRLVKERLLDEVYEQIRNEGAA